MPTILHTTLSQKWGGDVYSNIQLVSFKNPMVRDIATTRAQLGQAPCARDKLAFHSIVHRDIQEVCGSSRIL